MHNLKKQTEEDFTFIAFHAEKASVNFKSLVPANYFVETRDGLLLKSILSNLKNGPTPFVSPQNLSQATVVGPHLEEFHYICGT